MTPITVNLSDDLGRELRAYERDIPSIIECGLRRWRIARDPMLSGIEDVIVQLLAARTPEEILAVRANTVMTARVEELLELNRSRGFSAAEQAEWDRYEMVENFVRMIKADAFAKQSSARR